jgi:hypothetical protein
VSVEFYEGINADDKVKRCRGFLFQTYSYIADLESSVNRARVCLRTQIGPRMLRPTSNHPSPRMVSPHSPQLRRNSASPLRR